MVRLFVLCVLLGLTVAIGLTRAATERPVVYVAKVEGMIDMGVAPFVARVLKEAQAEGARAVVLDIDTFGGRLDAAVAIRDALLQSPQPTIALVTTRAISAGALIALATNQLAMGRGATIGAATPVELSPGGPNVAADEKTISYVRKEFRATAERRGRPPALAEAMVDAAVEIPGVVEKGKLLTLTTEEGLEHGLVNFRAENLGGVLQHLKLEDAEIRVVSPAWAERVVRFVTNPMFASLLMTIGLVGILVELRTPGFGVPGLVGLGSLGLFFWGHWIARLAGLEELALIGVGILLLALELLVIPGFGIAGILGILALLFGLGFSLVGAGTTVSAVLTSLGQAMISFVVAIVVLLVLLRFAPRLPFARGIVLQTALAAEGARLGDAEPALVGVGSMGIAESPLRPAGVALFGGRRVDVVSEGSFIPAGSSLEVTRQDGNRIVVRHAERPEDKE